MRVQSFLPYLGTSRSATPQTGKTGVARRTPVWLGAALIAVSILFFTVNQPAQAAAQADDAAPFYPLPDTEESDPFLREATVIGGEDAAPGAWPWTVALIRTGSSPYYGQFCGGSLIHSQWVLTAAHCLVHDEQVTEPSELYIWAHSNTLTGAEGEQIDVEQVIVHEEFSRDTVQNDIALLKLATPVDGPSVGLPTTETLEALGAPSSMATIIGWGTTATSSRTDNLQQVDLPIVDHSTCADVYNSWIVLVTDSMLCAGYPDGGYDACSGDSGGPLVVPNLDAEENSEPEWIQVGVVSWGRGCAEPDAYGVYTRTSSFIEWVEAQLGPDQLNVYEPNETDEEEEIRGAESSYRTFLPLVQN